MTRLDQILVEPCSRSHHSTSSGLAQPIYGWKIKRTVIFFRRFIRPDYHEEDRRGYVNAGVLTSNPAA